MCLFFNFIIQKLNYLILREREETKTRYFAPKCLQKNLDQRFKFDTKKMSTILVLKIKFLNF